MSSSPHTSTLVFSLSSYEAPTTSLKALSLVSRSGAFASQHRVFRVLKPIDVRDIDTPGSVVHTLLRPGGWRHAYDVRSVTIVFGKLRASSSNLMTTEETVASVLNALPHVQHVKLVPDNSYMPRSFEPVVHALSRLSRLESLDVVDFHASTLMSCTTPNTTMADTWAQIAASLISLRVTINQADRVENRRNPVFRTILANASCLRALEFTGTQATKDVVQMLAALQHPEKLKDLRVSLGNGQALGGMAAALNRLEQLEELSISIGGGMESVFRPSEKATFGRSDFTESLGQIGIRLNLLRHLHLTCSDDSLVSLGLGCAVSCSCETCCSSASISTAASNPYLRWLSKKDSQPACLTNPFLWGAAFTPMICDI